MSYVPVRDENGKVVGEMKVWNTQRLRKNKCMSMQAAAVAVSAVSSVVAA